MVGVEDHSKSFEDLCVFFLLFLLAKNVVREEVVVSR